MSEGPDESRMCSDWCHTYGWNGVPTAAVCRCGGCNDRETAGPLIPVTIRGEFHGFHSISPDEPVPSESPDLPWWSMEARYDWLARLYNRGGRGRDGEPWWYNPLSAVVLADVYVWCWWKGRQA